jgi:hypothetical protein
MRAVTTTLGTTLLALIVAASATAGPARQCVNQSEALVGQRARLVDKDFPLPRTARRVQPDYPTRPGASKVISSIWIGEALVDQKGKVRDAWTIRPLRFEPAWPEFEAALLASIRQTVYEPAVVDGNAVAFCVTISVRIDF